jgi:hypothetical protein
VDHPALKRCQTRSAVCAAPSSEEPNPVGRGRRDAGCPRR